MAPELTCAQVTGGVTITPANPALSVGDTLRFGASLAIGMPCGPVSTQWRWSSSAPAVVAIDSLSGLATAVAPGSAAVFAVPTYDLTVTGTDTVVVAPPASSSDRRSVRPPPRGSESREGR